MAFAILTALSVALLLWQWRVALRFPLRKTEQGAGSFAPGVTLLKPLKGSDENTESCLESWFLQNYGGPVQILFGAASPDDPVCGVARGLMAKFPAVDAELMICDPMLGPNAKVSSLCHLFPLVKHEFAAVSDADVMAPADFLRNTMPLLKDEKTGLTHSFYFLANPSTLAMRYEAIATNSDFWSQVLQAASLKPVDFAMGAVMIMRKKTVEDLGLFALLKDYLADDYWMGRKIRESGKEIAFGRTPVRCLEPKSGWRAVYAHQARWAKTVRVSQPLPYFFSILSNPTLWPLLWFASHPVEHVAHMALICLLIRIVVADQLQRKLTLSKEHARFLWLVPVRDLLGACVWLQSFMGNQIIWRGSKYRVARNGKLIPLE